MLPHFQQYFSYIMAVSLILVEETGILSFVFSYIFHIGPSIKEKAGYVLG
jgi:hypothetical protein